MIIGFPEVSTNDVKKCTNLHIVIHFYYLFAQRQIAAVGSGGNRGVIEAINVSIAARVCANRVILRHLADLMGRSFWISIAFCMERLEIGVITGDKRVPNRLISETLVTFVVASNQALRFI